jgi:predicted transcriptional regulator
MPYIVYNERFIMDASIEQPVDLPDKSNTAKIPNSLSSRINGLALLLDVEPNQIIIDAIDQFICRMLNHVGEIYTHNLLSFRLEEATCATLESIADRRGITLDALCNEALEKFLKE